MRILKTVLSLENLQTRASLSWMQYFCATALKSYRVVSAGLRRALIFAIFFFKVRVDVKRRAADVMCMIV